MKSSRHERDEDVTVVSDPERILRDNHRLAAASSTATLVRNRLIAAQALEAASEEVAAPTPRADGEDTLDGLSDRPISE